MGVARMGVAPMAPPPIIAQVAAINDRLARQEAFVEAVFARMTTSTSSSSAAGALLAPANFSGRVCPHRRAVLCVCVRVFFPVSVFGGLDPLLFATRWSRHLVEDHNPSFIFIAMRDI